ncbi:ABC transporter ATP-binding protein [Clostridium estertheticum]|uniref:ABC transporter ATP-binding protein n=1 Tax=Clostridium estertheticum TaxID=238834 RepID=UPI001C0E4162|nr:ABC transporter ATP-binding protein [Clostridium estertheticum]MBU3178444.1 ABC transporter ATP-binding protein [Clostridium estertheticum]
MEVLSAEDIVKVYGGNLEVNSNNVLNGINLSIESGEFTAIMGQSGSGKTTLINILSGIDTSNSGTVKIMNKYITSLSKKEKSIFRRENLGIIFQSFNLLDNITLAENAALPLIFKGISTSIIDEKIKEYFMFFDIYDIRNRYPYNVSVGEQQRAAACRALINDPYIILADEPTGSLDPNTSKKFMKYLQMINDVKKATILMVTHDIYAASCCRRVIFIKSGKIFVDIYNKGDQSAFFNRILDTLAVISGE